MKRWNDLFTALIDFMDMNERLPERSDNKSLYLFMVQNQNPSKNMNHLLWENLRYESKYAHFFKMDKDVFSARFDPLREFMDTHNAKPSPKPSERKLLKLWRYLKKPWFYRYYTNADELEQVYVEFVTKYRHLVGRSLEGWTAKFEEFLAGVRETGQLPTTGMMARWYNMQMRECKPGNILYPDEAIAKWIDFQDSSMLHEIDSQDEA